MVNFFSNHRRFINLLRISLAIIFLWFGALKFLGYTPVYEIVNATLPFLAKGAGNISLGITEFLIGMGLLFNFLPRFTHRILILHLLGTFLFLIRGFHIAFDPYFPILSLEGEFVVKNIVLAVAGLVVISFERKKSRKD